MLRVVARAPGALSRAAPAGGVAFQHAFWAVWAARQASTVAPEQSSQPGQYDPMHALALVKKNAKARFDETVEVAVNLGVDPRKPGQSVRGVVQLPFGTGKSIRVAVFAKGDKAQQARDAGADIVGAEDLIKQIQAGVIEFDRCIATPDMMPLVGRVARILGPRGLMPNPKVGTVTADVADAVSSSRAGQVEFRVEKAGIVHAIIGRVSFPLDKLAGNLRALLVALSRARPEGSRGQYFRSAALSSTMGPGVKVNPQLVDPAKGRQFMASEPLPEGLLAEVEQAAAARAARREAWLKAKQARPKTIVNKWEGRATKTKAHA